MSPKYSLYEIKIASFNLFNIGPTQGNESNQGNGTCSKSHHSYSADVRVKCPILEDFNLDLVNNYNITQE